MVDGNRPKLIAIVGPTASGKSALAIEIAKDIDGEIISADSRQFYKGMNIGTGKVTKEEMQGITHHLIDFLEPDDVYTLFDFQRDAFQVISDVVQRGKVPLLVGGTGLFVDSVIENYQLSATGVDTTLRDELAGLSDEDLATRLLAVFPNTTVDLKNRRRVIRELEYSYGDPTYEKGKGEPLYDVLMLELYYERSKLYRNINKRVKEMFSAGLLEEVDGLFKRYGEDANALSAIGYREFRGMHDIPHAPQYKLEKVDEEIKRNSRRYAKRQITWFKRYLNKKVVHSVQEAQEKAQEFLKGE
jgi:tRNA dimethylallyltransferase